MNRLDGCHSCEGSVSNYLMLRDGRGMVMTTTTKEPLPGSASLVRPRDGRTPPARSLPAGWTELLWCGIHD